MERDHFIHIRCPMCHGPFLARSSSLHRGRVSHARLLCKSCEYRGEIRARIPVLMPPGVQALWIPPIERGLGPVSRRRITAMNGEETLLRLLDSTPVSPSTDQSPVPPYLFRKALMAGTERWFRRHIGVEEEDRPFQMDLVHFLMARMVSLKVRRVLEAASAYGRFTEHLIRSRPSGGISMVCDLDYVRVKVTERRIQRLALPNPLLPIVADLRALPVPDAHLDGVISFFGLDSVERIDGVLNEMIRVVHPGGSILVATTEAGARFGLNDSGDNLLIHAARDRLGLHHGASDLAQRMGRAGLTSIRSHAFRTPSMRYAILEAIVP